MEKESLTSIKMHSKYPGTFNVRSWEGSCTDLGIDKLYAERGVPVGGYQEWRAAEASKKRAAGGRPPLQLDAIVDDNARKNEK